MNENGDFPPYIHADFGPGIRCNVKDLLKNKWFWALVAVVALWFFWPRIGTPVRHAADSVESAVTRMRFGPPPPEDHARHTYRSVPLRITFIPEAASHDARGNITHSPWGGEWGIPRESPTVSGMVVANGTRVHDATLSLRTCPDRVHTCTFHWDVLVEFADNSAHLTVHLDEHRMGVISSGTSSIARISRPVVDGGLIMRDGHPVSTYSHIPVRGGQLFIEQRSPVHEAVASAP